MVRADMESAHGAPIATSGRHEAAGRVIGVSPCGCDPVCHDGRSVSLQTRGRKHQLNSFLLFQAAIANAVRSSFLFGRMVGSPKSVPSRNVA